MPASKPKIPSAVVGVPGDNATPEIHHSRTVGRGKEEYRLVWPSGNIPVVLSSDADLNEQTTRHKVKKLKKRHTPGAERYERNPHEPIKC